MKLIAYHNGEPTEFEVGDKPITAVVHQGNFKVEAPDAYRIGPDDTLKCMREMSQEAWAHISTGPLFKHFITMMYPNDELDLPADISKLVKYYDDGVVHICGLIVLLVEAAFAGRKELFLEKPETFLHPAQQQCLMEVIMAIQKMGDGNAQVGAV